MRPLVTRASLCRRDKYRGDCLVAVFVHILNGGLVIGSAESSISEVKCYLPSHIALFVIGFAESSISEAQRGISSCYVQYNRYIFRIY